jgi:hypothetical protein
MRSIGEMLCGAALAIFAGAAIAADMAPEEQAPTPAKDAFVRVFSSNPLGFNGAFVTALDAETTSTTAQKYGILKALVLAESAMSPRNVGQLFADAPPAVKARLKTTTKFLLDQSTSATLIQAAALQAEAQRALGEN